MTLIALPSVAVACSCLPPQDLTENQLRNLIKDVSLIARGHVVAVNYPLGCRVAPLRWAYSMAQLRLPVTYTIAVRETMYGPSVRTTKVVQHQLADFKACKPVGANACEAALPVGDALWVLNRMANGEQRYAGRCGLILAPYYLRVARQGT